MGKVDDRHSEAGRVGKEGLQEILELPGGALFNCEDACAPHAKGHPIWGASSRNDAEGRRENRMQWANFELPGGAPFLTVKRPSSQTQKGTPCKAGAHVDETGIAEEDVIGKEGLQETM